MLSFARDNVFLDGEPSARCWCDGENVAKQRPSRRRIANVRAAREHASPPRLAALDLLRGFTVAAMIVVNNPGNWNSVYAPLNHCTERRHLRRPDLPAFIFIMGVSLALAQPPCRHGERVATLPAHRDEGRDADRHGPRAECPPHGPTLCDSMSSRCAAAHRHPHYS